MWTSKKELRELRSEVRDLIKIVSRDTVAVNDMLVIVRVLSTEMNAVRDLLDTERSAQYEWMRQVMDNLLDMEALQRDKLKELVESRRVRLQEKSEDIRSRREATNQEAEEFEDSFPPPGSDVVILKN